MPFAKNAVLVKAKPVPGDDLSNLSSVKGEIANKLGKKLVEEYHADKVVLLYKEAEKLAKSKKVAGKTGLTYTVEVDSSAKAIEFVVHSGGKELARATLLAGLDKLDKGAEVINLQGHDDTMKGASSKQAKKFNKDETDKSTYNDPRKGKQQVKEVKTKLAKINDKKRIVLCGHGGGADVSGDQMYTASVFGGRNADEIVKFLIKEGLAPSYTGTIYLSGCHTAAGFGDPKSFAKQVHSGLAKKGYKLLSVAGTPGVAYTKKDGNKGATPDVWTKDVEKTIKKVETLIGELEKAEKQGKEELKVAEEEEASLQLKLKSIKELLDGLPPEALPTLEAKLQTPIETGIKVLAGIIDKMKSANKLLENSLKTERAYLVKLKDYKNDKDLMKDGTINADQLWGRQVNKTSIEEWWGVFGPAKVTKAKVQKSSDKSNSLFKQIKAKFSKSKV